ncbi:MAG TPA: hypothetical protein ENK73_02545, partial [Thiomicrospira sp.]|nr:hypothetical protein [Thiomicrospira sp.]
MFSSVAKAEVINLSYTDPNGVPSWEIPAGDFALDFSYFSNGDYFEALFTAEYGTVHFSYAIVDGGYAAGHGSYAAGQYSETESAIDLVVRPSEVGEEDFFTIYGSSTSASTIYGSYFEGILYQTSPSGSGSGGTVSAVPEPSMIAM